MYKTRLNNIFKNEFEEEIDARKEALLSFSRDPKAQLVEVLDEDDNVIFSKQREVEEEPTQELVNNGVDSVLRNLISECWDNIDRYNSAIATFLEEEGQEETIEALKGIVDDLNVHVGILESCLSK